MNATHTPTPWFGKVDGKYVNRKNSWRVEDEEVSCSSCAPITLSDGTVIAFAVYGSDQYALGDDLLDANAAFIVKACNAHDELVSALRAVGDELWTKFEKNPLSKKTTDQVRAALAKAGA